MIFNEHSNLKDLHAFLSPSKYHWIRYDDEKLDRVYVANLAAQRGDRLHKLAHDLIKEGVKLPGNGKTLSMYVNDALGYRMKPEQVLFYSMNAFGCVDTISFRRNKLRVHDLKTGVTRVSMDQPKVYVALFCLEYRHKPHEIEMEMRIYQNDEVWQELADPDEIVHIMDRIITFDKRIENIRKEALA